MTPKVNEQSQNMVLDTK